MSDLSDSGAPADALRERLGQAAVEAVRDLERRFAGRRAPRPAVQANDGAAAFDVLIAGGGLSLLYAVALARRGFRVAVADPRGAGRGHREWNASEDELRALQAAGVTARVVRSYDRGLVQWHCGPPRFVRGALDRAIDARQLLYDLRAQADSLGVSFLDGVAVEAIASGPRAAATDAGVSARLVIDARGAASPLARWDLVCPTVGAVLRGLAFDPALGEILVTTRGARDGRQPIWEAFPGDDGEIAVYLFEYDEPERLGPDPLLRLYARFFEELPAYKRGVAEVVRPAYGFIPGWSRLRRNPAAPQDRVLLVGDAAARHSPLTYCGFGSALRSFEAVAARVAALLERDRLDARSLEACWTETPSLRVAGALALMMIDRGGLHTEEDPQRINALLDAAFGALAAQGNDAFREFLQDRATPAQVLGMLRATATAAPFVWGAALRNLSARELAALGRNFVQFAAGAA